MRSPTTQANITEITNTVMSVLVLPILLWPSLVLVVALIAQSRGAYLLRPRHIGIFIAVQLVWAAALILLAPHLPLLKYFSFSSLF